MPRVSVIVPVYNTGEYLSACFDALINQRFEDFEVIVIDDGSTDTSGDICDEYAKKDSRFCVFHTENRGVCAARNKGLDEARGEYFCFVDSDDLPEPDFLSVLVEAADKGGYHLTVGKFFNDKRSEKTGEPQIFSRNGSLISLFDIIRGTLGYAWGKLYRSDVMKNEGIRFMSGITLSEDAIFYFDYMSKCPRECRACLCPDEIYHYVCRDNSALMERFTAKEYKPSWFDSVRAVDIMFEKAEALKESGELSDGEYKKLVCGMMSMKVKQCVTQMRIMARFNMRKDECYKLCRRYVVRHLPSYAASPFANARQKLGAAVVLVYPKI